MKNWIGPMVVLLVLGLAPGVRAEEETTSDWRAMKKQEKRDTIDAMAGDALDRLFEQSAGARTLYDKAHGYAVFDNWKFGFIVTGGGGSYEEHRPACLLRHLLCETALAASGATRYQDIARHVITSPVSPSSVSS